MESGSIRRTHDIGMPAIIRIRATGSWRRFWAVRRRAPGVVQCYYPTYLLRLAERELIASGEYMSKRENVLLVGNPGIGKTHLAFALGFAACAQCKKVRFTKTTAMVIHLLKK